MLKRFCFGPALPRPPPELHPLRITRNMPLDADSTQTFTVQWFADRDALTLYDTWAQEQGDGGAVIVADEIVQRGADWLAGRWAQGGVKFKHVALARRQRSVSQAEFSRRWRDHAGRANTTAGRVAIPEAARGLAYVQNHPLLGAEWPFDAITEVWFDTVDSMQARVAWFRDNAAPDELFAETLFISVKEEILSEGRSD